MKPVLEHKKHRYLWIIYIIIFITCIAGIGISMYLQFYKDEKIGLIFGITDEQSEIQDEYNEIKANFSTIFTNNIDNNQSNSIQLPKIIDDYEDYVVTAYTYEKLNENIDLKAYIPYFNINKETTKKIDQKINESFKAKAESYENSTTSEKVIYTVSYKAYIQQDIISLIIRSELKEGTKNQKIEIKTFNYNIKEDREITLEELLRLKNINVEDANKKIKDEIKSIQEQNNSIEEALGRAGTLYKRDYNSNLYDVQNAENFFLGKDGMVYVVYAYGNKEDTSEIDLIIFK